MRIFAAALGVMIILSIAIQYFERWPIENLEKAAGTSAETLPVHPATQLRPAQLLFESDVDALPDMRQANDGDIEIYAVNADGIPKNLTKHAAHDSDPIWSPNGSEFVFVSDRDGPDNLYRMRADGTDLTRLTDNHNGNIGYGFPRWSPAGTHILFNSYDASGAMHTGPGDTHIIARDGTGKVNLSDLVTSIGGEAVGEYDLFGVYNAAWAPDGRSIVFTAGYQYGQTFFFLVSATGANLTQLTPYDKDIAYFDPSWSPDGKRLTGIATTYRPEGRELRVIKADGSGMLTLSKQITFEPPAWSPDGSAITYITEDDGVQSIKHIGSEGQDERTLLTVPDLAIRYWHLQWSPLGTHLAVVRNREVVVINADGTQTALIPTNEPDPRTTGLSWWHGTQPAVVWSPDGTQLAVVRNADVVVINADGTNSRTTAIRKDVPSQQSTGLSWSPNGDYLAVARQGEIYLIDLQGMGVTNVTNSAAYDSHPIWQP